MGIEAATSSVSVSASSQAANSISSTKVNSKSENSFKDEMAKVSEADAKNEQDTKMSDKEAKESKTDKKAETKEDKQLASQSNNLEKVKGHSSDDNKTDNVNLLINESLSLNNANMMLSNDIQQMIDNSINIGSLESNNWSLNFGDKSSTNLKMNESDADFFITLTQTDNVNLNAVTAQAQNMINQGADSSQIRQNVQVSQTLLNALADARENNQPLRIDFDQNISVILRVGRDGAISAQFIPGDKAVEQYLKNNIESLKASFEENDLPYNELSYSNSSKEQNRRRRQEKRQGE